MEYEIGSKYLMYISLEEYTMVLSEIIENPKEPERKYRMEYDKKHRRPPGLKVVCTAKELSKLEKVTDDDEEEENYWD